jgi:hypothetical protein
MNTELIRGLIGLRYKLLWAKTRSRNGRIALFFSGYLLFILVVSLLVAGGFGAGIVAVRSGKAELVAQIVLGSVYVQALIASISLGFGMNSIFSDLELRRYPVRAAERFVVRHIIGIVDPFWMFFLVLDLGLATGLYVYGGAPFGQGILAVLLLFLSNYLLARVIGSSVDRIIKGRSGTMLLTLVIISLAILPSLVAPALKKHPEWVPGLLRVLSFTAPFGAASAMVRTGMEALWGLLLLALWIAAIFAVLIFLENRPPSVQRVESGELSWKSNYEKVASLFPADDAPFVAHWLRFYIRNNRFRALYLVALPLVAFLTYNMSRRGGDGALFATALGTFPILTFLGTSRMAVNQYGYVGGGLRRYLLLPCDPVASLRAGAYASMLLGGAWIPVAVIAWAVLVPGGYDPRQVFMLAGSALTGLFIFHGLGLWVSMLNPRKGNYSSSFGNDLSLGGNIVLIGGVLVSMFLPQALHKFAPALVAPGTWWIALFTALAGVMFFSASLRAAGGLFRQRRERLLAIVEGRD